MLRTNINQINFNSPIILASGTVGYGDEMISMIDFKKVGAIITKSITLNPRKGNPSPRIHEVNFGMINSIGLANIGVDKFCKIKLPKLSSLETNVIISVAGSTLDEYIKVITKIEKMNGNHIGYELNVSCPNTLKGGIEFGVSQSIVGDLITKIRPLTKKLLIVKLTPNVTNIEDIAFAAESSGADAVSAINTFIGLGIDYKTGKMVLSTKFGGVSGPAIKPLALAKVHKIYQKIKIPIIGMGGITNHKDIIEFVRVGSQMVQVGTLNYRDPFLTSNLYDELKSFLLKNNLSNIQKLKGVFRNA